MPWRPPSHPVAVLATAGRTPGDKAREPVGREVSVLCRGAGGCLYSGRADVPAPAHPGGCPELPAAIMSRCQLGEGLKDHLVPSPSSVYLPLLLKHSWLDVWNLRKNLEGCQGTARRLEFPLLSLLPGASLSFFHQRPLHLSPHRHREAPAGSPSLLGRSVLFPSFVPPGADADCDLEVLVLRQREPGPRSLVGGLPLNLATSFPPGGGQCICHSLALTSWGFICYAAGMACFTERLIRT